VELLKQDQYIPMPVEKQVASIFTGTNGYLDELSLTEVQRFEKEFLEMMEMRYSNVLDAIAETKELSKDLEANLHNIAKEFVQKFKETIK
jgi:F-type H+-transporting ATPase subunit alpha